MSNPRQFRPVARAKVAVPNTPAELHRAVLDAQFRRLREQSDRALLVRLTNRHRYTAGLRFDAYRALRWLIEHIV